MSSFSLRQISAGENLEKREGFCLLCSHSFKGETTGPRKLVCGMTATFTSCGHSSCPGRVLLFLPRVPLRTPRSPSPTEEAPRLRTRTDGGND